ncbi:MAG TPA: type II secretion system F family protein, partial [Sphingomicrobium sp.]|nr:type II secretion system F family protein [Sphingomicrobium sp.]
MQQAPSGGPHILGFDVMFIATMLSAVATFAVLLAIYAATTVKDPMARRVKALNERREQLKAGIVASTNKRKKLTNRNQAADNVRQLLSQFKMLQEDQVKKTQTKLMQAGIRTKDLAFFIIFARFVLPVVIGIAAVLLLYVFGFEPQWSALRRYMTVAGLLVGSYKAPDIWLKNKVTKRSHAIRKGLPDALDLLVICAEAGLTVDAAFGRVSRELGKAYPELGDEFGLTAIELGFLNERRQAFENLANRVDLEAVRGVVTTMIQTEKYGTPLASALRVLSAEFRHQRM